jgi:hypothetical protein
VSWPPTESINDWPRATLEAVRAGAALRTGRDGPAAQDRRYGEAQAAGRRTVKAIERQLRERTEAGLPLDGLPDLSTEGERDGFYQAQLIRDLAVWHVASWTRLELEVGPAPPTPENISAVMEIYPVGKRFFQDFTLRQLLLNTAKNGCMNAPRTASAFFDRPAWAGSAAAMYPAFDAARGRWPWWDQTG